MVANRSLMNSVRKGLGFLRSTIQFPALIVALIVADLVVALIVVLMARVVTVAVLVEVALTAAALILLMVPPHLVPLVKFATVA